MKIFISYPREKFEQAEQLCISLEQDGHEVFFDGTKLPKGVGYDNLIRKELQNSELMIFLVSPESIDSGSYCLTELTIFKEKYPKPSDHILPVMIAVTEFSKIPNYLKAVTVFRPIGNFVAETAAQVAGIAAKRNKKLRKTLVAAGCMLLIVVGCYFIFFRPSPTPIVKSNEQMIALKGFSVFEKPDKDSKIIFRINTNEEFILIGEQKVINWTKIILVNGREGWTVTNDIEYEKSKSKNIDVGKGFGFRGDSWQLFFSAPQEKNNQENESGIENRFAQAIDQCKRSLHLAVYEMNSESITNAIIGAHKRGVEVQVLTDNRSKDFPGSTFNKLSENGITVKTNYTQGALMHNKFAVMDDTTVWTGSYNYTLNATYNNNENLVMIESPAIAAVYNHAFKRMYVDGIFKKTNDQQNSTALPPLPFNARVYFTPNDDVINIIKSEISKAKKSIRFMFFSFTLKEVAELLNQQALKGVNVKGIVEQRLDRRPIFTDTISGSEVRQDGNPRYLHHKVIIIDDKEVITGSMNMSTAASTRNSENVLILEDDLLASKYAAEFERLWKVSVKRKPKEEY